MSICTDALRKGKILFSYQSDTSKIPGRLESLALIVPLVVRMDSSELKIERKVNWQYETTITMAMDRLKKWMLWRAIITYVLKGHDA